MSAVRNFFIGALVLGGFFAHARQPDGTLGLIRTPNNGIPAVTTPGGTIQVECLQEATLTLTREGSTIPLQTSWQPLPGQRQRGTVSLPAALAAGGYTLVAEAGDIRDEMPRAVFIFDAMPDYYVLAHVSDTHVGSGRHARTSEAIVADVFNAVNASDADIALITGDLTDQGTAEQFRPFLQLLDTLRMPSFVCPGNHDRAELNYEQFFGPVTYSFTFGRDGYLSFDSKDFITADSVGPQDEEMQVLRRALKPSRWSIGFTHRYEPSMGMRSQFVLFVDDPLDYLLFGHWHRENTADQQFIPWGKTRMSVVPAAINGAMRLIDVTENRLIIRPVQQVAAIE